MLESIRSHLHNNTCTFMFHHENISDFDVNDTRVNDFVTFTVTFRLKIILHIFVVGGISVSQILLAPYWGRFKNSLSITKHVP